MFSGRGGNSDHRNLPFRGGGRGRGRWGGRRGNEPPRNNQYRGGGGGRGRHGGRGRNRPRNNKGTDLRYNPSAFDPIEEIGDLATENVVRIAVEGCCHGELDLIYERLMDHETTSGKKIDLLICCGDFQSLRNPADFLSSSIPPKFRRLGTFAKYYSGEKTAPILTVFIGGNHEASQPLRELYYGGFVAPNIYYMGAAGVVTYRGIRIGGISGIYKSHDYRLGHHERIPFDYKATKSVYHVRKTDVERVKLLAPTTEDRMDVFVSHDWPLGIEQHGDTRGLIRKKPFFRSEIERNDLGSLPNREILDALKPKHWFSAHLHVKFHATVVHSSSNNNDNNDTTLSNNSEPSKNHLLSATQNLLVPSQARSKPATSSTPLPPKTEDPAITIDPPVETDASSGTESRTTEFHAMESSDSNCKADGVADLTELMTKFLALDKCLPRRQFLSVLNVPLYDDTATRAASDLYNALEPTSIGNPKEETPMRPEDSVEETETNDVCEETTNNKSSTTNDPAPHTRSQNYHLEYDPEWLAILKQTHHWTTTQRGPVSISPLDQTGHLDSTGESIRYDASWVTQRFKEAYSNCDEETKEPTATTTTSSLSKTPYLEIPRDFVPTVPYAKDPVFSCGGSTPLPAMGNPQTDRLLRILDLDHIITRPYDPALTPQVIAEGLKYGGYDGGHRHNTNKVPNANVRSNSGPVIDDNEIDIDDDDDDDKSKNGNPSIKIGGTRDDNEIDIDDDDDSSAGIPGDVVNQNPPAGVTADDNEIDLDDDVLEDDEGIDNDTSESIQSAPGAEDTSAETAGVIVSKKARLSSPTSNDT